MKVNVNVNWFGHENIRGISERSFQNNDKKNEHSNVNFFIVKKQKQNSNEFSNLIIEEFKGKKIMTAASKISGNFAKNERKADEISVVNFLNEYWA